MSVQNVIQWRDLFAVVDDGHLHIADYQRLEKMVMEQAKGCPFGVGCLVILPQGATPPPDEIKRYVNDMLGRLGPSMRSLAYVVEGHGFKAAAARAALVGMKIFLKRPYPVFVETTIEGALTRMLPTLEKGHDRRADVPHAARAIALARAA